MSAPGTIRPPDAAPLSCDPLLRPGNTNCGGCGMSIGLNWLGAALAELEQSAQLAIPACCGAVTAGAFPTTSYAMPTVATTFAASPAVATGLASIRDLNGLDHQVICWAGDGGTYDIGLATLSAAAERNEDILYICYDNEIYGNTGGQRSSATPATARTTTTPHGKGEKKKDIIGIMAAHRIPYAATLSIAHPEDFQAKLKRALQIEGFRFFLLHAPCPTGWKTEPAETVELVRLAVRSGVFPLYEVYDGLDYRINIEPDGTDPVEYFDKQKRFGPEQPDLASIKQAIADRNARLLKLAGLKSGP